MYKFRWVAVAVSVMMLLMMTTGTSAKVKLIHMQWASGYGVEYMKNLEGVAREFEKLHPEVEIEIVGANNLVDAVILRIASNVAWDTATLMPHQGLALAKEGAFRDLRPFMAKEPNLKSDYIPGLLDSFTLDNVLWGLPQSTVIQAFGYNKTLFEEGGQVTPDRLIAAGQWNWTTAKEIAKKLCRDTNGDRKLDIWGMDMNGSPTLYMFTPFVDQAGGQLFDRRIAPTSVNFLSLEVRKAAEYYLSYWIEGIAPLGSSPYLQGKAAMNYYDGPRAKVWESLGMVGGLTIHPKGPARGGTIFTSHGVQISAKSKNPEYAWEWVKFLTTSETGLLAMFNGTGWLPPLRSALKLWAKCTKVPENQKIEIIPVLNDTNRPRYVDFSADAISRLINSYFTKVITGEMSLGNALEALQVEASATMVRAGGK